MMETDPTGNDPTRRLVRGVAAFSAVLALMFLAAIGFGLRDGIRSEHMPTTTTTVDDMLAVAPGGVIDPADVPAVMAVLYRGAVDHPEDFAELPCFCGCAEMLGHRHLLDCFQRPDGSGWEAHASGCGVCLGEAEQALSLLDQDMPIDDVRSAVIERWGDPYLQSEES